MIVVVALERLCFLDILPVLWDHRNYKTHSDVPILRFQQEEDLEPHERARLKKLKALEDSSEEEEDGTWLSAVVHGNKWWG